MKLTESQKQTVLILGSPNASPEPVNTETFLELIRFGLVFKRAEGLYDFTDIGQAIYQELACTEAT